MEGELTQERVEEMMQYVKERHRSEDDKPYWTKSVTGFAENKIHEVKNNDGKMPTGSIAGNYYACVGVDDASRFILVDFVPSKDLVSNVTARMANRVATQGEVPAVKYIRMDGGCIATQGKRMYLTALSGDAVGHAGEYAWHEVLGGDKVDKDESRGVVDSNAGVEVA